MTLDRARVVDEQFIKRVKTGDFPRAKSTILPLYLCLNKKTAISLFD